MRIVNGEFRKNELNCNPKTNGKTGGILLENAIMQTAMAKRLYMSVFAALIASQAFGLVGQAFDSELTEFPRWASESDDSGRIQRAIDKTEGGVLYIPKGVYEIASTLVISNSCALMLHKNAKLLAVKPMDCVLRVKNDAWRNLDLRDYIVGGAIDGNGLASCLVLDRCWGYRLSNLKLFNPKKYGLVAGKGVVELDASGVYVLTRKHGLSGNAGIYACGGDNHFTDIFVLDCTIGVRSKGASNRFTRIHVWGGSLPRRTPDEVPEMLIDSVSFWIEGHSNLLRDCYSDTGGTGFLIDGAWEVRLLGCSYFNNPIFGLDDVTIVRQQGNSGALLVSDAVFTRATDKEKIRVYDGNGGVCWRDIIYAGHWQGIPRPGLQDGAGGKLIESPNTKLAGD